MPMRSETELIRLIERLAGTPDNASLRVGIGDDAAVLASPKANEELLVTTDQIVENVHFVHGQHPPDALGHKLLVRGLSDIAAMGGEPIWFLLSLALPSRLNDRWIEKFLQGLFAAREKCGAPGVVLAGGDVSGSELFTAHVTVAGTVPAGQALLRSGCGAGDALFVSGLLGGSALGLERLVQGTVDDAAARHLRPTARLALGRRLRESGVRAALDISDGLSTDLNRLAEASSVRIQIHFEDLPRFPGASDSQVLHGGEEYELLFSVPPAVEVPASFEGVPLTRIGTATSGDGVALVRGGLDSALAPGGFEHLVGDG